MKRKGLISNRSKSSFVNPCRTGKRGFKSLPLHNFPLNIDLNNHGHFISIWEEKDEETHHFDTGSVLVGIEFFGGCFKSKETRDC